MLHSSDDPIPQVSPYSPLADQVQPATKGGNRPRKRHKGRKPDDPHDSVELSEEAAPEADVPEVLDAGESEDSLDITV